MKHREYIAQRELRDTEFRDLREASRPVFDFQCALIRARTAAKLTQKDLADQIGTTQSAVAKWENGTNIPKIDTVQRLAGVLGVNFEITPSRVLTSPLPRTV